MKTAPVPLMGTRISKCVPKDGPCRAGRAPAPAAPRRPSRSTSCSARWTPAACTTRTCTPRCGSARARCRGCRRCRRPSTSCGGPRARARRRRRSPPRRRCRCS
ncbi:MAG: hypothetical protein J3K34DRAFT_520329, partial [Monoraphidium minutum]